MFKQYGAALVLYCGLSDLVVSSIDNLANDRTPSQAIKARGNGIRASLPSKMGKFAWGSNLLRSIATNVVDERYHEIYQCMCVKGGESKVRN